MTSENETLPKFKPERPIYLNETNTGLKTKNEVLVVIANLRKIHWLCAYNENSRPFHMSFNDERMFQQFKKDCKSLNITLKSPIIHDEEVDALDELDNKTVEPEPTQTFEDPSGAIHVTTTSPTKK